jgi:hypothetical protein
MNKLVRFTKTNSEVKGHDIKLYEIQGLGHLSLFREKLSLSFSKRWQMYETLYLINK